MSQINIGNINTLTINFAPEGDGLVISTGNHAPLLVGAQYDVIANVTIENSVGKSAFQSAVEATGFDGNEAQWVSSLQGGITYPQTQASRTWVINHNLGYMPAVMTFSVGGVQIDGSVAHISNNTLSITFLVEVAGFTRLN